VHFGAVFNKQKTQTVTRSLGTRILRFSRETRVTKAVQKLFKNSQLEQEVAVAPSPHPWICHCCPSLTSKHYSDIPQ